jgi:hypothetical protein
MRSKRSASQARKVTRSLDWTVAVELDLREHEHDEQRTNAEPKVSAGRVQRRDVNFLGATFEQDSFHTDKI